MPFGTMTQIYLAMRTSHWLSGVIRIIMEGLKRMKKPITILFGALVSRMNIPPFAALR